MHYLFDTNNSNILYHNSNPGLDIILRDVLLQLQTKRSNSGSFSRGKTSYFHRIKSIDVMNHIGTNNNLAIENNTVMIGLLDACIKNLQDQGMKKMFIDGISSELDALKQLGKFLDSQKKKTPLC